MAFSVEGKRAHHYDASSAFASYVAEDAIERGATPMSTTKYNGEYWEGAHLGERVTHFGMLKMKQIMEALSK